MKILLITNKIPYPPKDGGAIATFNLAKGLADLNHDVTMLSLNTSKHHIDLKEIPEDIAGSIKFIGFDINTDIRPLNALKNLLFSKLPYNAVRFIDKGFDEKIIDILKTTSFDIIQLEGLYICPYINTIRENTDAPVVYRAHNIENEIWQRTAKQEKNLFKKKYIQILTKRIQRMELHYINKYDAIVPITQRDADVLKQMGNNKPYLVSQTGFDLSNLDLENTENDEFLSIFNIGALDWTPNQEGLIWFIDNCWEDLKAAIPEIKFHIAGRNAPDWFVNKINIDGIIYEGEVDDAYEFMRSKGLMLVPLLSGSGMRIKIIEGMALGKTIVSTSIGAEGIPATDNLNIAISDNHIDYTNKIIELLSDKNKFDKIGANAQQFIKENFDNLAIAKKLEIFYSTLKGKL